MTETKAAMSYADGGAKATGNLKDRLEQIAKNGSVFSKNNPAKPLAYTIASLDREQRLMNTTIDYTKTKCKTYANRAVQFKSYGGFVAKFTVHYTEPGKGLQTWTSDNITSLYQSKLIYILGDATINKLEGVEYTGLVWNPIRTSINLRDNNMGDPNDKDVYCYALYGTTLNPWMKHC